MLLACKRDNVRSLLQICSDDVETILCQHEQGNLSARVRDKHGVARLVEYHFRWSVVVVPCLQVNHCKQAISLYSQNY